MSSCVLRLYSEIIILSGRVPAAPPPLFPHTLPPRRSCLFPLRSGACIFFPTCFLLVLSLPNWMQFSSFTKRGLSDIEVLCIEGIFHDARELRRQQGIVEHQFLFSFGGVYDIPFLPIGGFVYIPEAVSFLQPVRIHGCTENQFARCEVQTGGLLVVGKLMAKATNVS